MLKNNWVTPSELLRVPLKEQALIILEVLFVTKAQKILYHLLRNLLAYSALKEDYNRRTNQ